MNQDYLVDHEVLEQRARLGAVRLSRSVPGWMWRINLDSLSMSNAMSCVLGQLYQNYFDGLDNQFPNFVVDFERNKEAARFGFVMGEFETSGENYQNLTKIWKEIILEAQALDATEHMVKPLKETNMPPTSLSVGAEPTTAQKMYEVTYEMTGCPGKLIVPAHKLGEMLITLLGRGDAIKGVIEI